MKFLALILFPLYHRLMMVKLLTLISWRPIATLASYVEWRQPSVVGRDLWLSDSQLAQVVVNH